jgi:hypothetical protein
MQMTRIVRRAFVALLVVLAICAVPIAAAAGPPETTTTVTKDTDTFVDVIPFCADNGPLYELTIDYILVLHETVFADGSVHATFTQTGTFVAVAQEPGEPDASGRFTQWGGFNQSPGGAVNGTFTFSVRGRFEDGTKINFHLTDHFNVTPTGAEFFFTHCHD